MVINHFAIIILPSLSVNQIIINKAYFPLNEDYYEDISLSMTSVSIYRKIHSDWQRTK